LLAAVGDLVVGRNLLSFCYPPDTLAMMWGSAWKTDRCASCRVRTLADVELLAARMVEGHWPAIVRVAEARMTGASLVVSSLLCRCYPFLNRG
jgi:hypothetical protein